MSEAHGRTLVFLLSEDWFFVSHFIQRARAARAAGWRVVLLANTGANGPGAAAQIAAAGVELVPIAFERKRLNPFAELALAWKISRIYKKLRPDVLHHVALKPIIVGGVAARLAGINAVLTAPVGLGFVYSSDKLLARILKPLVSVALRFTLSPPGARVVFENPDDLSALQAAGMIRPDAAVLIRGAGVDMTAFQPAPEPAGPVRVVLIARMIREKGIAVFVEAARLLRGQAEFVLVGAPDPGNPNSCTQAELKAWEAEGLISWLGPRGDIAAILQGAHIACQPSTYREGLPKSALEAAAAAKPLVTTDVPGCREAVEDGVTGILVPPGNPAALAAALKTLIDDAALRARMGEAGRVRAMREFSDEIVCARTLMVYDALSVDRRPA